MNKGKKEQHAKRPEGDVHRGGVSDTYRLIFEQAQEGIVVFDLAGTSVYGNRRVCDTLACELGDLPRLRLSEIIIPEERIAMLRDIATLKRKGVVHCEVTIRKKNGKRSRLSVIASVLNDSLYVAFIRDITNKYNVEQAVLQSGEQFRALFESAPVPMALFVGNKLARANTSFRSFFRWLEESAYTSLALVELFGKSNAKLVKEFKSLIESRSSSGILTREVVITAPDGTSKECEVSVRPVAVETKKGLHFTFVDITARRQKVRELEQTEERFRRIVEDAVDAVSVEQDEKLLFVNRSFLSMLGFPAGEEVIGKDISIGMAGKDKKTALERSRRRQDGEDIPDRWEYRAARKDGSSIDVEVRSSRITLDGKPAVVSIHRDITERKLKEHLAQQRIRLLDLVQESSLSTAQSLHLDDVLRNGLQSVLKGIGWELGAVYRVGSDSQTLELVFQQGLSEQLIGKLSLQSVNEGITGFVVKTMEPVVVTVAEYPPHLPYKSLFETEGITGVAYIPSVSNGVVNAVLMAGTRNRRALDGDEHVFLQTMSVQLGVIIGNAIRYTNTRSSEEQYRSAVEGIPDIIYRASPNGALSFISPNIQQLIGYAPEEFYRSPDLWRTLLHPDDRAKYSLRVSNHSLGNDRFNLEYRILPKGKAKYLWFRDAITYKRNPDGTVAFLVGLLSDITERVELEDALTKSEELKGNVLRSVREGVVVYDADLKCIDWNPAMEAITGVPRGDVVGKPLSDSPDQFGLDELKRLVRDALRGNEVSSNDIPLTVPGDLEPRYIWARYAPLLDSQGATKGVVGIITDVTSRRKLEHEAKESEQILRNVIDGMGDALMICDLQGKVWEVNREFSRITGHQRSKVLGLEFPYPWLLEEEMAKFVAWISALREMNELRDFDMTWKREDGETVAMSLNTTLLRNALGEPVAMLNIARDISDRRRLATELEKKNTQIELLNRIISKANSTIDFSEIFATISSEVLNLVHYDQINVGLLTDDAKSLSIYACHSPIDRTVEVGKVVPLENTVSKLAIARQHGVVIGHLSAHDELGAHTVSISEGFESQISIPIFVHDRLIGTFNIASIAQDAYNSEDLVYLQPIADQIGAMVDRVRLFQQVSDDSTYIHNLLNSINSVVYTADQNYRITEVNKTWREFARRLGLERYKDENSLPGTSLWEIIPQPELRSSIQHVIHDLFDRKLEYHLQEYDIQWDGEIRTYHLAINPMVINDRVTGLVFIHTDISEIKRREAEIRRRNKELLALNTISTSISRSLYLDEVLRVAAEQIKEMVGADAVLFYLRDDHRDDLHLSYSLGLDEERARRISVLPAATSVSGAAMAERKPLLIEQGLADDVRVTKSGREVFRSLGIDSVAAIPLQSKDKVLGAMDVAFRGRHAFDSQEQQLLTLIGNQIGPAIENAILYKEVQDQVQRITSLYMIGKGLTGALDLRTVFEIVYSEMSRAIPIEQFAYAVYSDKTNSLTTVFEVVDGRQHYYRTVTEAPPPIDVATSGMEEVIRGNPAIKLLPDGKGMTISVPVRTKQRVIGLLSVTHSSVTAYSETHLRLFESIGNLTEIALDKAMLYEDTINKSIEIQNRNKELDDFTYVVSHDLKEPLIGIEGYSKILLKDYNANVDEEGKEYLGLIVQSSARMKNLIEDLLTLSRVGRASETTTVVSVADTVSEIIRDLQFTLREKNIRVVVEPNLPHVHYNPTQLSMVFRNLISNAMKFNTKPDPKISVGFKEEAEEFIFSVADNGIGIEEQYFDRIFMIFQRLQRSEEFRGTGAGLTIVKKIVEYHHGRIWLESTLGEGSTFYFTIPKNPLIGTMS